MSQAMESEQTKPGKLTDSPWFWLLAFTACGLILLEILGPKYQRRQAQLERQHQARQWAQIESAAGREAAEQSVEYSSEEETEIPLWPIRGVALAILCVSTVVLWMRRR
jgi:hypothetical protein